MSFSDELAPYLARAVGIALSTVVVSSILVSLLNSCGRSIAIPRDRIAPVLATMAAFGVGLSPPELAQQGWLLGPFESRVNRFWSPPAASERLDASWLAAESGTDHV